MRTIINLLLLCAIAPAFTSCQLDEPPVDNTLDLPRWTYEYNTGVNDNIPTLGRVLFYDKQLSANNSVSCSSCHKQNLAFADNVRFSEGFDGALTERNSMPIQNVGFGFLSPDSASTDPLASSLLFWDGREHDLRSMVLQPIVNDVEMGITSVNALTEKLSALPYYPGLFRRAYGDETVTSERIADALSNFLLSITSMQTKFDQSLAGGQQLTSLELLGKNLFMTTYDCNSCHQVESAHGYLETGGGFANVGLDAVYADNGLGVMTGYPGDNGKFKIPSLRNVALTAPYMHDGRFETLEEVMEHYSEGIEDHPALDERLRQAGTGKPIVMDIPEADKQAIISFLHTLTDLSMTTDKRFSDPFRN